jgi:hypothetical protein
MLKISDRRFEFANIAPLPARGKGNRGKRIILPLRGTPLACELGSEQLADVVWVGPFSPHAAASCHRAAAWLYESCPAPLRTVRKRLVAQRALTRLQRLCLSSHVDRRVGGVGGERAGRRFEFGVLRHRPEWPKGTP